MHFFAVQAIRHARRNLGFPVVRLVHRLVLRLAFNLAVALGQREPVIDVARNLERWVDAAVIRTYSQQALQAFATAAPRLHVVNALTNEEHPCQAIADVLTLQENQAADFTAIAFTSTGDTADLAVSWSVTSGSITDTSSSSGQHRGRFRAGADTGKVKVVAFRWSVDKQLRDAVIDFAGDGA